MKKRVRSQEVRKGLSFSLLSDFRGVCWSSSGEGCTGKKEDLKSGSEKGESEARNELGIGTNESGNVHFSPLLEFSFSFLSDT